MQVEIMHIFTEEQVSCVRVTSPTHNGHNWWGPISTKGTAALLLRQDQELLHPTLPYFLAEMHEIKASHFQALEPSLNQAHSIRKHPHHRDPEHDGYSFICFIFQPAELLEYV